MTVQLWEVCASDEKYRRVKKKLLQMRRKENILRKATNL